MPKALAKTLAAVLVAVAAAILALNGARVISVSTRVLLAAVVTTTVLAAVSTIGGAWTEWREQQLGHRRELVDFQLDATLWAIVDQVGSGLDYRDLGIAIYRTYRRWWWPFRQGLRRVQRVRATHRPVSSNIIFRPGKGVIGRCVETQAVAAYDLAQMYRDLGQPTEDEWASLPVDITLNLSYTEYLDARDKYAVVIASPIIDDASAQARVRGCIVLDGPDGRFADLNADEVLALLNSAAQGLLRQVL
ncbi:MAG: hypothetical protein ABWX96_03010 [Propionibacteriaceae bacterium]